jgi:hypothetical protein
MKKRMLLVVVFFVLVGFITEAQAQSIIGDPFVGRRAITLDIQGGLSVYANDVGWASIPVGVRLGIPIVHNGFVGPINNAVYINFGVDTYWWPWGGNEILSLGFPVVLHWAFYFTPRWSAFAELGFNIYIRPFWNQVFVFSPHWIVAAVGGKFHFNDRIALVLRLGAPYFAFGISISF